MTKRRKLISCEKCGQVTEHRFKRNIRHNLIEWACIACGCCVQEVQNDEYECKGKESSAKGLSTKEKGGPIAEKLVF